MIGRESGPPEPVSAGTAVQRLSLSRPFLMCVILLVIALLFRWIDTFVLRLDERLGELIFTKSLGFVLVLAWVWAAGRKVSAVGLQAKNGGYSLMIGAVTTLGAFLAGYGVEILVAARAGAGPALRLGAIDPKMGVTGGALFALWLVSGNVINSFMEEGLFRGVMGRLARVRTRLWSANVFQAFMFGIWHLPWVLKYYQLGELQTTGEIVTSVLFNSVPQFLIGVVYGYFYLRTGNLWAPWIAHTISNSTLNLLHVATSEGLDGGLPLRMGVYAVLMLLSLFWVRHAAAARRMSEARPWE